MKKIKKTFLLMAVVLMIMICFVISASAKTVPASGSCGGNVTFTYNSITKEVVISGSGRMTDRFSLQASPFSESDIRKVVIKSGVTNIGRQLFQNCAYLTDVVIPEGVTEIEECAFYGCTSLKSVKLPASLNFYGSRIFEACKSLEKIIIHPDNKSYYNDIYGAVYSYKYKKVCEYPEGSKAVTYIMPSEITFVEVSACMYSSRIRHLVLSENLETIGRGGFAQCGNIESVVMYDNVSRIVEGAFANCNRLRRVYYTGSKAQWDKISIDIIGNDALEKANIIYNYNPELIGKTSTITATQSREAVNLIWSAVTGANTYRVYLKTANGWKALGNTMLTSVILRNLVPGTKYTYAVKAGKTVDGKTIWSDTYTVVSTATHTFAPSGIIAAQNTSAIRLSWKTCPGATGYRIFYKSGNTWKICLNATTATSHTFTGLKAGSKFTFAVRPYIINDSNVIWSPYSQFTTATKPAIVTAKASSPSAGKITLTWDAVNGADGYQVYYKINNGAYKLYKVYPGVERLVFSNLKPNTTFTFAVRAGIKTSGGVIFGGCREVSVTVK